MSLVDAVMRRIPLLLALALASCSQDEGSAADGGISTASDAGTETRDTGTALPTRKLSELHGDVDITIVAYDETTDTSAHTNFSAKLRDGAQPEPLSFLETMRMGDCVLYEPNAPFCEPKCPRGSVCVSDGKCEVSPGVADVGTVTVEGLGDTAITAKFIVVDHQLPAGTKLPYPPCAPGELLTVSATGGDYPEFSMEAACLPPLELSDEAIVVDKGKVTTLTWAAPGRPADTRVHVTLDISAHAGTYGQILCDTDDDGLLDIPEPLVTGLMQLGYAGGPSVAVTREAKGKPVGKEPTGVDYTVAASLLVPVEIPGLVSCLDDADCPDGQTCQWDKQCK